MSATNAVSLSSPLGRVVRSSVARRRLRVLCILLLQCCDPSFQVLQLDALGRKLNNLDGCCTAATGWCLPIGGDLRQHRHGAAAELLEPGNSLPNGLPPNLQIRRLESGLSQPA